MSSVSGGLLIPYLIAIPIVTSKSPKLNIQLKCSSIFCKLNLKVLKVKVLDKQNGSLR